MPAEDDSSRDLPKSLAINAWVGTQAATAQRSDRTRDWLLGHAPSKEDLPARLMKSDPEADPKDWRDERVGWGLVLARNPALAQDKWSTADDAPEPIQALVRERGRDGKPAPVLRYLGGNKRVGTLHRDGVDLPVSQSPFGTGPESVPRYLLLYATPEQIPWDVQYMLNARRAVGRLTLQGTALENYVAALRKGWQDDAADHDAALVWAVDHGAADITHLMRKSIAERVLAALRQDTTVGPNTVYLDGSRPGEATRDRLSGALAAARPGFILTTSHGQTGPLDNLEQMAAHLGLPVDEDHALVQPAELLAKWQPGGAIWYAHACCSAGSDARTLFDGLVQTGSLVDQVLKGVARVGARVAPLPLALLGASKPIRAFVGHVEPTFDWTLQHPQSGQHLTAPIVEALYEDLFRPSPIGLAMGSIYGRLGSLYEEYDSSRLRLDEPGMLQRLLVARDVQSTVILGDPTAMLPIA